jgi:redox-sensitive bicupin YhaK (pirin superfamily)
MNVWDVRLNAGHRTELRVPEGHNTLLFVSSGQVYLGSGEALGDAGLAIFDRRGDSVALVTVKDSKLLLLSGEPIDEPVVAFRPFVMNTEEEIRQEFDDFRTGRMGQLVS